MDPILVSVKTAANLLSMTAQTIYRLQKTDPNFPRVFKVGFRKSAIYYDDIVSWVKKKKGDALEARSK